MSHLSQVSFDNYNLAGDLAVIAICLVIGILLRTSYVSRTRSLHIFMNIIVSLVIAALINIFLHFFMEKNDPDFYTLIYILRLLYHGMLFEVFFLFALYITEITGMERKRARGIAVFSAVIFVGIMVADIILIALGYGFHINEDGTVANRTNLFMIGYGIFIVLLLVLILRARSFLYKRIIYGFYGIVAVSVLIRAGQIVTNQSSLTTMTLVFPAIGMLYIMHSNPYNAKLGAVDNRAMEDMVRDMYSRKEEFYFISLLFPDYDEEGKKLPPEMRAMIRRLSGNYFRNDVLFQLGNGHVVLVVPVRGNADYEQKVDRAREVFREQDKHLHLRYKIVSGRSVDEISRKNEYASLIRSIESNMDDNCIRRVSSDDIDRFNRSEYILQELADIYAARNLNDPRVLAFCQPVFNIQTGRFDTAEALMRLNLKETGVVLPDEFIPIAEYYGYIHVLTEIILNKACREIRRMTEEGFMIGRISVNVSVLELKDDDFCSDINRIIGDNDISGDRIAIELTESRSEADFMIMKEKIEELRQDGIIFYLDDFGTGYSNMERIMELPFDIIKFDRSMVTASKSTERSQMIVDNLAHMFKVMGYAVLYEGVEDTNDARRCSEMSASYLQGFIYSRPVPIEQLREFMPKVE